MAPLLVSALLVAVLATVAAWRQRDESPAPTAADRAAAPIVSSAEPPDSLYPVTIHRPSGPPRVQTDLVDQFGDPVTLACGTCHATRTPDLAARDGDALGEFHQGLTYRHGTLTCYSCHDPTGADRLRLADGRGLPYEEVLTLCAQCHGRQAQSYARGAHGGMTGHWDLSRGPRERNNCVDCHDPHAPAFPRMLPTFKPRDRFVAPPDEEHRHE